MIWNLERSWLTAVAGGCGLDLCPRHPKTHFFLNYRNPRTPGTIVQAPTARCLWLTPKLLTLFISPFLAWEHAFINQNNFLQENIWKTTCSQFGDPQPCRSALYAPCHVFCFVTSRAQWCLVSLTIPENIQNDGLALDSWHRSFAGISAKKNMSYTSLS